MRVTIFGRALVLAIPSLVFMTWQSASGAEKLITTPPASGQAQQLAAHRPAFKDIRPSGQPIVIQRSHGTMIRLPSAASTVFVADAEVADVQVIPPEVLYVIGKKSGQTVLYASDAAGNIMLNRVIEVPDRDITIFRGAKEVGQAQRPLILQIPLGVAPTSPPP